MRNHLVGFALVLSVSASAQPIDPVRPHWSQGETWQVDVTKMTEAPALRPDQLVDFKPRPYTLRYAFSVDGVTNFDGEPCSQIAIRCVAVDGSPVEDRYVYRIYIRQQPTSLKRVERLTTNGVVEAGESFAIGPASASDWVGALPLEFPLFDNATSQPPAADTRFVDATQESLPPQATGHQFKIKSKGGREKECVQKWEPGKPWWTEATLKLPDKEPYTAKLITNSSK